MGSVGEKKPQDASSAARIRDNQRRSRARRRELIEELKARVREYERQGVQATLEMREAARRVALENSRLRVLLSSRGVTNEEVDQYLASFNDSPSGGSPTAAAWPRREESEVPDLARPPPVHESTRTPLLQAATPPVMASLQHKARPISPGHALPACGNRAMPSPASDHHLSNHPPTSALDTLAVVADASMRQTCCGPTTQCTPTETRDVPGQVLSRAEPTLGAGGPASRSESLTPGTEHTPTAPTTTASSHLEMSCTAAARIMASICRDGSEEKAREAMGCSGPGECFVKNTVLFQLLDKVDSSGAL